MRTGLADAALTPEAIAARLADQARLVADRRAWRRWAEPFRSTAESAAANSGTL
jgi:hypothetical protein